MYVRTTQRRNSDGSVVRYVQLAAKKRVEGKSVAQVLVNLGREDELDRDGLARLVASINRYLGVADASAPQVTAMVGDQLTVAGSRPMGTTYLLDGLWRQLGIGTALSRVLDARKFTTDVERVLFALVANRAVDPLSKLAQQVSLAPRPLPGCARQPAGQGGSPRPAAGSAVDHLPQPRAGR